MAYFTGSANLFSICCHGNLRLLLYQQPNHMTNPNSIRCQFIFLFPSCSGKRWLSTSNGATPPDFAGRNAYDLLGVSETSSVAEIKASFHRLAKETHPDLAQFQNDPSVSHRFVQILAAYEILSDSEKRAHYDQYLLSQRTIVHKNSKNGSVMFKYESHRTTTKQMEVVEWLKWYRLAIQDILLEKKVIVGSGYFDVLERDFYSAIHAAYYGPEIGSLYLLPDRFEAEERSVCETSEVLHLVSGCDLFGMVCIADKNPVLPHIFRERFLSFASNDSQLYQVVENVSTRKNCGGDNVGISQVQAQSSEDRVSDAYKDLELHVAGRVVAMATRVPSNSQHNGIWNKDSEDHIHVYLSSHNDLMHVDQRYLINSCVDVASGIPLGTITGLGTNPEEESCSVYNSNGIKTHVIMNYRTLMVKHMHWYQVGDKVSVCECRCSRAQLPPSKFWLFEPRCGMHDIGGWYVETYGRDKKGRTFPSQRYWDGLDSNEQLEKRLHPAIYLLTLAYRTLDIEDAKRRKQRVRDIVKGKMVKILSWCKKLV